MGSFTTKVKKKLKKGTWYPFYNTFYEKVPVDKKEILIVSRSGLALESNILAILKELSNPEYQGFRKVLAVQKNKKEQILQKLNRYHISVNDIVTTRLPSYYYHLAKAGWLITDTTFPGRYIKKDGQTILNVWHGTPLKHMGQDNPSERYDTGNVMRNLLQSDYLTFPNLYMEDKMSGAYNLKELYQGTILHEGYPRNCIFFHPEQGARLKEDLGYAGIQLSIYMPTFRGTSSSVQEKTHVEQIKEYLSFMDAQLNEKQIILVKLHPFVQSLLDISAYRHIRPFPKGYDTYEILNACDVLITDYSSVMYDFAVTGRRILLFAYDLKQYQEHRGMYEDISSYPFPVVHTPDELIKELNRDSGHPDDAFLQKYATFEQANATRNICRHVFLGEKICQEITMPGARKKKVLLYAGSLQPNGITAAFYSLIRNLDPEKCDYYISYRSLSLKEDPERLQDVPDGYHFYPLATEMNLDVITAAAQLIYLKSGITAFGIGKRLDKAYDREWKKHFGCVSFDHVIHYDGYENYMIALLEKAPCIRTIFAHNDMEMELAEKHSPSRPLLEKAYASYEHVIPVGEDIRGAAERIGGQPEKIRVISNYVDFNRIRAQAEKQISFDKTTESTVSFEKFQEIMKSSDRKFINIGRYSPEKGHERLIRAFDRFYSEHPDTWLIIIGGMGHLYEQSCSLAASMKSGHHIVLLRSLSNPMPILKACDFFLLSSYYEGLGLVVLEADILGVPVASCDVNGPHSIMIKYGGTLLPNSEDGLVQGMEMFLRGEIHTMNVDYEKRNQEILQKCEELFQE